MTQPERFRDAQLVLDVLRRVDAFASLRSPVDVEVIPNFSGEPEGIEAWLIFGTPEDALSAQEHAPALRARAESLLIGAGFPATALATLVLRFTSLPEIEQRGGRFAFFR